MYWAIQGSHLKMVKLFLEFGVDVNESVTKNGETPILVASYRGYNGSLEIIEYLLSVGADISIKDNYGNITPLIWARERRYHNVVECLEKHQAKIENQQLILQEHLDSGVWINDPELFKLLSNSTKQFFIQANILAQLLSVEYDFFKNRVFLEKDCLENHMFLEKLPIELFHELLIELWGLYY